MSILKCLLLLCLSISSARAAVISTANFGGSTYYLLTQGTWAAKEAEAVALGGHLATISSDAENQFVYDLWRANSTIFGLWIGLNDIAVEGQFRWTSGLPVTYTHFPPTEPNGGTSENAVHLDLSNANWNDNNALSSFQAVAEVSSVPKPSGLGALGMAALLLLRRVRRISA